MAKKKNKKHQHAHHQNESIETSNTTPGIAAKAITAFTSKDIGIQIAWVVGLTFIAFFPSLSNDFVFWDDPEYVTQNPFIKDMNFSEIFAWDTFYMGNYHPLTLYSLCMDYILFEFDPFGYHLFNVLYHLANTSLVFMFIYWLIGKENLFVPAITAVLFGIHPMHVESVTWVSERKDVLYTFFFLGGLLSYLKYSSNEDKKYLVLTLVLFLLSCLAKAQAVVFAPALVLIDLYKSSGSIVERLKSIKLFRYLEKIPFFIFAVIFGKHAITAQQAESAINENYEGAQTILYGSYGILTYIYKMILPIDLAGAHPYPSNPVFEELPDYFSILPIGVLALGFLTYWFGRKDNFVWFGVLFFLGTVSIVLKFVPVGDTIIAERYTYIPYIGLFFIFANYMFKLYSSAKTKTISMAITGVCCLALAVTTFGRTQVWENTTSFWMDVQETYPNYWRSYNCIGSEYSQAGEYEKAIEQFTLAAEKDKWAPPIPYLQRGAIYTDHLKNYELAAADYLKVLSFPNEADPSKLDARYNLGLVYFRMKKYQEGIDVLNVAIQRDAANPKGYYFKGLINVARGELKRAEKNYTDALARNPNHAMAWLNRGVLYVDKMNQPKKGIEDFKQVLRLQPNHTDAIVNIGIGYYKLGNVKAAIETYDRILAGNPKNGRVIYLKALVYAKQQDFTTAIKLGNQAVQLGFNVSQQVAQWQQAASKK